MWFIEARGFAGSIGRRRGILRQLKLIRCAAGRKGWLAPRVVKSTRRANHLRDVAVRRLGLSAATGGNLVRAKTDLRSRFNSIIPVRLRLDNISISYVQQM